MSNSLKLWLAALITLQGTPALFASLLSPEEAIRRYICETHSHSAVGSLAPVASDVSETYTDAQGNPCVYGFLTDEGYILLSADDCGAPLLGRCEGAFISEGVTPPGLSALIRGYVGEISAFREIKGGYKVYDDENAILDNTGKQERLSIHPLVKTRWGQNYPFNTLCPIFHDDDRCQTGCVVSAVAQVMHYFRYPSRGIGKYSYVDEISGSEVSFDMDFNSSDYIWDMMPEESTGDPDSIDGVARLMRDLGIAFGVDYACGGENHTAVSLWDAGVGLIRNFGYSPSMKYEERRYFSSSRWEEMIYGELLAGRPIVYEGGGKPGETDHAFVCDGYDAETGLYHFNWGWEGDGDGYFSLSALRVNVQPGDYDFSYNQGALTGIVPASEEDLVHPVMRTFGGVRAGSVLASIPGEITLSVEAEEYPCFYSNILSESRRNILMGLELENTVTGERMVVKTEEAEELLSGMGCRNYLIGWSKGQVPEGDYTGRPVAAISDEDGNPGVWEYVRVPIDCASEFNIHFGSNHMSIGNALSDKPLPKVLSMCLEEESENGVRLKMELTTLYRDFNEEIDIMCFDGVNTTLYLGHTAPVKVDTGECVSEEIGIDLPESVEAGDIIVGKKVILLSADGKVFYEYSGKNRAGLEERFPTMYGEKISVEYKENGMLELTGGEIGDSICIYDLNGRMIIKEIIGSDATVIDMSSYSSGVYLLRAGGRTWRVIL